MNYQLNEKSELVSFRACKEKDFADSNAMRFWEHMTRRKLTSSMLCADKNLFKVTHFENPKIHIGKCTDKRHLDCKSVKEQ